MRVLLRDTVMPSGATAGAFVADLCVVDPVNGYARIRLRAYTTAAAFTEGRPDMGTVEKDVSLASIPHYGTVWDEVCGLLLAEEFAGGSVGEADPPPPTA